MSELIEENCGVVLAHSLVDAYTKIGLLQHRGQDAVGIEGFNGHGIDAVKWMGHVGAFSLNNLSKLLPGRNYHLFGAHVRYATKGRKDRLLQDAHPYCIGGEKTDNGNHVIIRGAKKSIIHNGQVDQYFLRDVDPTHLSSECDSEALLLKYQQIGPREILTQVPGSYSAIIFDTETKKAVVLRDRHEIKPLCYGMKDGKYEFASETRPLEKHGGRYIRDVRGGEMISIDLFSGEMTSTQVVTPDPRECFFEITYLQHPDSYVHGTKVSEHRKRLGRALEEEFHPEGVDIVTYVPSSPEFAAIGYAEAYAERHGVDFDQLYKEVLYKMSEERAFILSTQNQRENSAHKNMHMYDNVDIARKTVLIIDDSIIRGTESEKAIKLLRQRNPAAIYFASYTPPVGVKVEHVAHGCEYGVDIPPNPPSDYNYAIRRYGSVEGVRIGIGANILHYLSEQSMFSALGISYKACHRCIGGKKIFAVPALGIASS